MVIILDIKVRHWICLYCLHIPHMIALNGWKTSIGDSDWDNGYYLNCLRIRVYYYFKGWLFGYLIAKETL